MSTIIKDMLQDMRELRANLQHSLVDVPNYAIAQRCDELDAQIAAVEAIETQAKVQQADAAEFAALQSWLSDKAYCFGGKGLASRALEALKFFQPHADRYLTLRSCALEPDSAVAAAMDTAMTTVFKNHANGVPTVDEFDNVVDAALAAAHAVKSS